MFAAIFNFFFSWFSWSFGWLLLISIILYLLPAIILRFLPTPNLKSVYQTEWALVTGGSSGIGAALTEKLCKQGLNVIIAALDDDALKNHVAKLQKEYPKLQIKGIGVDLTNAESYMKAIEEQTKGIEIGILFNNAGFLRVGNFPSVPIEGHMKHMECNVNSYLRITHHFYSMWKQKNDNKPRLICFTSSSAGFFFAPYSTMYGATKAFVTHFASSFAVEAAHNGVHVCCFHPQYTKTALYNKTERLGIFDILEMLGDTPEEAAEGMVKSCGYKLARRDFGWYSLITRIFTGLWFEYNILTPLTALVMTFVPEFKKYK